MFRSLFVVILLLGGCASQTTEKAQTVELLMKTNLGDIQLELYPEKAPLTVGNFLTYVDKGLYKSGSFYRVVHPKNDNHPLVISVIQGGMLGLNMRGQSSSIPPIGHESTQKTGLKHDNGAISMARGAPGTAQSEFFISLGDNPVLDHGGLRNADGLGFAVFGRVVNGLDIVKLIQQQPTSDVTPDPYVKGQMLTEPVIILDIKRIP